METAVHGADVLHSAAGEALDGACPQFRVGDKGILDKYRKAGAPEGLGYLLDEEGVAGGAGSDPDGVYPVFQDYFHVAGVGDFRGCAHP